VAATLRAVGDPLPADRSASGRHAYSPHSNAESGTRVGSCVSGVIVRRERQRVLLILSCDICFPVGLLFLIVLQCKPMIELAPSRRIPATVPDQLSAWLMYS